MDARAQSFEEFEAETVAMLEARPAAVAAAASAGPYVSQFGAVPYYARHEAHGARHEWLVKGVLTRGEQGMLVGASQAGKSFLALDLSMAIARGVQWFDCKTRRGLVIYHAGESAKGVRDKRLPAYDLANSMADDADIPFVLLTKPLDLFNSDDDCNKLIAECKHWQAKFPEYQLELLTIDTLSAATPGADENAGKDVSAVRRRCKRIEQELGCAVLIVHHKNAAGTKHRGHSSMFADVENVLDVSLVQTGDPKDPQTMRDVEGRKVRVAKITKLKDGGDEREWRFTLRSVRLGEDEDGEPVTSCVIEPPDMGKVEQSEHEKAAKGEARLGSQRYNLLKCIERAIRENGREAPAELRLPSSAVVVEWRYARDLFAAQFFDDKYSSAAAREKALKTAMSDGGADLVARGYIEKSNNWVLRTAKRLPGERRRQEATMQQLASDEPIAELSEAGDWLMEGGQ